jgi:prepilin-type N-terminal cleavage/methylation domain-containing protein
MKHQTGFTLIEIAVVLAIIGLLIGSLLMPLVTQLDNARIQSTNDILAQVKEALIRYAVKNNRLPCPAKDTTGAAVAMTDALCGQEGYLPWANLGVGNADAWGNALRYRVYSQYTQNNALSNLPTTPSNFMVMVENSGNIEDVAAVVLSYGKNGQYASNALRTLSNMLLPTAIASASSSCATGKICYAKNSYVPGGFDDSLVWLTRTTLVEQLVAAGKLQPQLVNPPQPLPPVKDTVSISQTTAPLPDCAVYSERQTCVIALNQPACEACFGSPGNSGNNQTNTSTIPSTP